MKKSNFARVALGVALIVFLAVALPSRAQAGSKPPACSNVNVTSAIADTDTSNTNLPFQLQSDGLSSYTTSTGAKVTSQIQSWGCGGQEQLFLDTSSSTTRSIRLTLAYPLVGSTTFAGGSTLQVPSTIISRCGVNSANGGVIFSSMSLGQTLECPLSTAFSYGGKSYVLKMSPDNWPGSTWIQVACTGTTSGVCSAWTLSTPASLGASNGYQTSAIGNLYEVANGNKTTLVGQYYVALSATLTNP